MNKLYLIIVHNISDDDLKKIKNFIGLEEFERKEDIDFMSAQFISEGYCIGKFDNNLIIINPYLVFKFYNSQISDFEHSFCQLLQKSQITILTLYSVIDSYGFGIIDKGNRKRVRYGGENKLYFEYGEKIKEEIEIEREGFKDDYSIGSGVVYRLLEKYFGKGEIDVYSILSQIKLTEYK